ncbi:MAG: hypothetical protein COV33_00985 [Candidatus Zambryskibacteria bacterium CG10_big_fil_rev_8_21_14_0_10_34_34]|uniref:Restriction endonuclease n=1 Tax=Candidatus Zambryskibacteria bacterium CG10_big_fil_rev_8_21_14_0_10_34_34 TaxID=1975114 RepID=A0A2H0R117_9BACT|nr:MAG: hypothetical protein COV33_00985 [Candidatus Zambryskibacteria bacterium CG10_big_fil_rev_8_21_14_0_10_34_34]
MTLTKEQFKKLKALLGKLKEIQDVFYKKYGVNDIYSNSKIFEILIANELNHILIPGHSGSKDAKDEEGEEFEYKHFKETSGNHSWTFNDYTDTTIIGLSKVKGAIFAHIDDTQFPPKLDWYILVDGKQCSKYLKNRTEDLLERKPKGFVNKRKMINFSALQLERDLHLSKTTVDEINKSGRYYLWLKEIFEIAHQIEEITGITQILTSNKFWELLVSLRLGHQVLSEQAGHDAIDKAGNLYEYKISKNHSWNFQDISDNVLKKYEKDKAIILATVNKEEMKILNIFSADSLRVINRLREKLDEKRERYSDKGGLRRLQVSLSKGDLEKIEAIELKI